MKIIKFILVILFLFFSVNLPVRASRNTDSYDGNIFPIYAGNGSIVPPQTTLRDSIKNKRLSILFFYLDDSSASKAMAPIISGLDLIWRNDIDIIALTTDEIQSLPKSDPNEPSYYWNGLIPQTLVLDENGVIRFNQSGLINIDEVNKIISEIKGLENDKTSFSIESFNEYNSRISENKVSVKD